MDSTLQPAPNPVLVSIPDNELAHSQPRKKQWCFTLFYREEGVDVRFPDELPSSCTYLVCQRDIVTGKPFPSGIVTGKHRDWETSSLETVSSHDTVFPSHDNISACKTFIVDWIKVKDFRHTGI